MKYALLVYEKPGAVGDLSQEEMSQLSSEYWAIRDDPRVLDGAHLAPATSATTVRARDGQPVVTDGPFADTKEVFGGYYLVEADDLDGALEIAGRIPVIRFGGSVEVRPMNEVPA